MIGDIIRLIRPAQWIKNLFVFLPLFFGGRMLSGDAWAHAGIAFAAFSLMASAIYCLNDIRDAETDRQHPEKRRRPVASGAVPVYVAWIVMILLVAGSECICWLALSDADSRVAAVINIYLILNIAYSLRLKQVAIVDVFIIALGFVLRLLAGGVACRIPLSPWIVLMTFLLALFLAFAKRRDDVIIRQRDGVVTRKTTHNYNMEFMNSVLCILASITMVCYMMYTVQPEVTARMDNNYIYISSILVLAGLIRYLQLAIVDEKSGDPTKILLHDKFIQLCCVLWILFFVLIIY